jgi:undecaprenyl-diphosphatase
MIREILLGNSLITVISLFIGGIILLFIEKVFKRDESLKPLDKLSIKSALVIGFFQAVSIIPGVSRSAASIIGGLKEGLTKEQAVEFSFLLAIPTVMGATLLDLIKAKFHFSSSEWGMLGIGTLISFITAWITVNFFLNYVKNHSFKVFGIYRIGLAIIYFLFFLH